MNPRAKQVLLVDDNATNRKVEKYLLEALNFSCDVASSGQEALALLAEHSYSVVLMDCLMPDMDGYETAAALRKLEELTGTYTPIIACTAKSMAGDSQRCVAAGMDDFISKPIDGELLNLKLRYWMKADVVQDNGSFHKLASGVCRPSLENLPLNVQELEEFFGQDELRDVLDTYVATAQEFLSFLQQALRDRDFDLIARLAHELKSASASVGAREVARLAMHLEHAGASRNPAEAQELCANVTAAFTIARDFVLTTIPDLTTSR